MDIIQNNTKMMTIDEILDILDKFQIDDSEKEIIINNKHLNITDIGYFFGISEKSENGSSNTIRENILYALANDMIPKSWFVDHQWFYLRKEYQKLSKKLIDDKHEFLKLEKIGGRNEKYDFLLRYLSLEEPKKGYEDKLEFKYNKKSIDQLPQILQIRGDKFISSFQCYAEFFYDNYLDGVLKNHLVKVEKPSKDEYLKHIHQSKYSALPIFEEMHNKVDKDKVKIHGKLPPSCIHNIDNFVKASIGIYLKNVVDNNYFNLDDLNNELKEQTDKIFILWKNGFYTECLNIDDVTVINLKGIKNNNSLVFNTKSGKSNIHVLLRWKNNKGILLPAWQISFKWIK